MDAAAAYGPIPGAGVLPNASSIGVQTPAVWKQGEKLLLYAGRLEPVKNPLLLLRALRRLAEENRAGGLRCVVAGGGSMRRRVENEIRRLGLQSLVVSEPAVPFDRMAELYRSAYILVLPSVVEGFPTTVLEAGAFGVPAIATDTIGNRDAVIHGETGLLVPPNDEKALAEAIFGLAQDPALRNRLGQSAFNRSREFTIDRTADAFVRTLSVL
jgi:glycosyltransferase involved in cell wall biosynthesis